MKKYLIIGGAGFIGSHLSKTLLAQGNSVSIIDSAPQKIGDEKIVSYTVNGEDAEAVSKVFQKEKPDAVFYLAGPINLRRPVADELFLRDINFLSRIKISLDACVLEKVSKMVFVSSGGAIYENAKTIPTSEQYEAHPNSLYGLANLMIEKYIQDYSKNTKLDFAVGRLSNVYGPLQWNSGFIPATIAKLLNSESPVIYGDGHQTRDFIYIDDAVCALIALADRGNGEVYNIGSGKEVALNDVALEITKMLKSEKKPIYKEMLSKETERSAVDVRKMKEMFAWQPVIDLKDGLTKTIQWYQENNGK